MYNLSLGLQTLSVGLGLGEKQLLIAGLPYDNRQTDETRCNQSGALVTYTAETE